MTDISKVEIPTPEVSVLGKVLHLLQMGSVFYTKAILGKPWGIDMPPISNSLMFHLVVSGRCVLEVGGLEIILTAGDFVILPHGSGHSISDQSQSKKSYLFDLPLERISDYYETLVLDGDGDPSVLLCGAVNFSHPAAKRLLQAMPAYVHIDSKNEMLRNSVKNIVMLLSQEAEKVDVGGEVIITRLADVLVMQSLRAWLLGNTHQDKGWLAALSHPKIGKAISSMHEAPETNWTVVSLAEIALMSRSSFSNQFKTLVGEPPLHYLKAWRMELAANRLKMTLDPIIEVALDVGYGSEIAFGKAFKGHFKIAPGAYRNNEVSKDNNNY